MAPGQSGMQETSNGVDSGQPTKSNENEFIDSGVESEFSFRSQSYSTLKTDSIRSDSIMSESSDFVEVRILCPYYYFTIKNKNQLSFIEIHSRLV